MEGEGGGGVCVMTTCIDTPTARDLQLGGREEGRESGKRDLGQIHWRS